MVSKWFEYKNEAVSLRRSGVSIRNVEKQFHIPRSTLSGWFKEIELTEVQKEKINKLWLAALSKGRKKAILWHNQQKENRLLEARTQAWSVLSRINTEDKDVLELALAMLYLGEGAKRTQTSMGNSNPEVIKFFIRCLNILYHIKSSDMKYYLHLRSDQNAMGLKKYWANELKVPIENFSFSVDKRTIKSATYPNYKGVCVVHCGRVAILRKLGFISEGFCSKILEYKDS